MSKKYVYMFHEGNANMKELLGGKGANLAEMTGLGLPVPRGFTVTTEACTRYYEDGEKIAGDILDEIKAMLAQLEKDIGKTFGDPKNPLLVSVRSGSRASMPGMMDTILNLGLNDEVVDGLSALTSNERFAYDSYRRFIQMFSDVVMGIEKKLFEDALSAAKASKGVKFDTDLDASDLKGVVSRYKEIYESHRGESFPQDPQMQLIESVKAVFRSWNNERAVSYRRLNDIPSDWGTAVNVQEMVYGNMGEDSGTGVAFTRDPGTGDKVYEPGTDNKTIYGEFLMNAQGEDVVAGIRTPMPLVRLKEKNEAAYSQLLGYADTLEKHYRDMQDMEFTIEKGKLHMLQTRNGKRTAQAAVKIAVELVGEGMLGEDDALLKIDPKQLDALLHPVFEPKALKAVEPIAKGLDASPGAATGKVYFDAKDAVNAHEAGEKHVLLVRAETSPEDIDGMNVASGILTSRGGKTSHAAVVGRQMGKCCVVGCNDITIDEKGKAFTDKSGKRYSEGDWISLDGTSGKVYDGMLPTVEPELDEDFFKVMAWADKRRKLRVRTNADKPEEAAVAIKYGAEGIGLCRTEHMFFHEERIARMREMIVAETEEQRRRALNEMLPMQREDFEGIFEAMDGLPVTIRLLDPPLHEFLPKEDADIEALAKELGISDAKLRAHIHGLDEINPMLGNRGCRLAVMYPEIAEMQTRAIIEAAVNVTRRGVKVLPEIMIPLVSEVLELKYVKETVKETADKVLAESGMAVEYMIGTMIEIPRAALTADQIAKEAEFFSFGTNDLTQMAYGLSRDDASKILDVYYKKKIFESDPTSRIDVRGVGRLVEIACELGRKARPGIKLGICGEHGGDPSSVEFCHGVGLDYVSCSPFRVPIARLAAAQAALKDKS